MKVQLLLSGSPKELNEALRVIHELDLADENNPQQELIDSIDWLREAIEVQNEIWAPAADKEDTETTATPTTPPPSPTIEEIRADEGVLIED